MKTPNSFSTVTIAPPYEGAINRAHRRDEAAPYTSFSSHLHHLARSGRTVCCGLAALWVSMFGALLMTSCKEIKNPVYICTGYSAECYHSNRHCEGLQLCGSSIKKVDLEDAKKKGRRPCQYCYGFYD